MAPRGKLHTQNEPSLTPASARESKERDVCEPPVSNIILVDYWACESLKSQIRWIRT